MNTATTHNITLTEEQLMLVLAALSDRHVTLANCMENDHGNYSHGNYSEESYRQAIRKTDELNREIRRQTATNG